jgi:hypothetical protein
MLKKLTSLHPAQTDWTAHGPATYPRWRVTDSAKIWRKVTGSDHILTCISARDRQTAFGRFGREAVVAVIYVKVCCAGV